MFTREVSPGAWSPREFLTVELDEWNWPQEVALTLDAEDNPRVFWYQEFFDYQMQHSGEDMYNKIKLGGTWYDESDVLDDHVGHHLDVAAGMGGEAGFVWAEKDNDTYHLLLNLYRPATSVPDPEEGSRLRLAASPNPFRDELTIRWEVPPEGTARLELFDVMGRRVAGLYDGRGGHQRVLRWTPGDEAGMTDGVYFLRLTAGAEERTQRVVRVTRN